VLLLDIHVYLSVILTSIAPLIFFSFSFATFTLIISFGLAYSLLMDIPTGEMPIATGFSIGFVGLM
jgi:hypothetical protein